jgi:hypothetical protein
VPSSFSGRSYGLGLPSAEAGDEAAIVECITDCANLFRPDGRLGRRIVAVREARYKLVFDFGLLQEQVFDLAGDPGEFHPLTADQEKPVRRRLLEQLRRHIATSRKDGDLERRLRAVLQEIRLESVPTAACKSDPVRTPG